MRVYSTDFLNGNIISELIKFNYLGFDVNTRLVLLDKEKLNLSLITGFNLQKCIGGTTKNNRSIHGFISNGHSSIDQSKSLFTYTTNNNFNTPKISVFGNLCLSTPVTDNSSICFSLGYQTSLNNNVDMKWYWNNGNKLIYSSRFRLNEILYGISYRFNFEKITTHN